ncbi:MAG: flagellar FliJ family protein [Epsilonproteobacteria bacterium]|nr:flagellar FliJ family protein [Campylobacterota bacterium]
MKTRYSSLVSVKKDMMQKSEREFQAKNSVLQKAHKALEDSLLSLGEIAPTQTGKISDFLANRALLDIQRGVIRHNEEWVLYAKKDLEDARKELQKATIEYEKYKYLELQEIEKIKQEQKRKESKELDEVALITFANNTKQRLIS